MSREQAQMLGKIRQDLIETRGKNIDCGEAAHQLWLGKDVYHCLGIIWDPRSRKCSRGCKINITRDYQQLQHAVVEFSLGFPRLVSPQLNNNNWGCCCIDCILSPHIFKKAMGLKGLFDR
jgi:hypothetical protein